MRGSALLLLFFCVSLSPLSTSVSVTITNPDSYALLAFKSSSSDPSNALSSWAPNSDPCNDSWLGVTCRNNRVTRLVLESRSLDGPVQPFLHLDQLRLLSLKNNSLTSPLPLDLSPLKNIKLLFLSSNRLSGPFPSGVSSLRRLRRLDLSQNRLLGRIPPDLRQLPHLMTLRLERNSFTGTLFDFSSALEDFNVSRNHLVGEIPRSLSVFPSSAFAGNENLCGKPLQSACSRGGVVKGDPLPMLVSQRGRTMGAKTILAIVFTDIGALALIVGVFFFCCRYWRRRGKGEYEKERREEEERKRGFQRRSGEEEEMVFFEGCEGFDKVEDLLRASAEMLGKGSVGTTYKAVVMGEEGGVGVGKMVVVKRVRERRKKVVEGKKEVNGLMREIGRLRHDNVVPLRAYYHSKDEMLLVYDFMSNGSLHSLLHGNRGPGRTPLDWSTRLKLAAGAARGLAFLHTACERKLAHGHLTSSNILVDHDGNACISEFAIDQLVPTSSTLLPTQIYKAPELVGNTSPSSKPSQKSDVYSFGVILLEMLTGKTAAEGGGGGGGGMDLVNWIQSTVREDSMSEVFDLELLRHKETEEEMVALLQVALLCLSRMPRERPKMGVVCKMIDDIRARGAGAGTVPHSLSPNDLSSNSSPGLSEDTPT